MANRFGRVARAIDMAVIAFLSVAPVRSGSMASDVAKAIEALEDFDVTYETTGMGTIIEGEDIDEVFSAAAAAHKTVDADRISTFLKVDHKRANGSALEKVESVEAHLGRPARSQDDELNRPQ